MCHVAKPVSILHLLPSCNFPFLCCLPLSSLNTLLIFPFCLPLKSSATFALVAAELSLCWRLPYSSHRSKSVSFYPLTRVQSSLFLALLCSSVLIGKAMVFPVVMYECESWTIKKAERRRIDAFEQWCWRDLRVPWTARRSNQSILKEISPEYLLGGLMLKLKLQYFGHLMQRTDSFKKTLMLGRIESGQRRA